MFSDLLAVLVILDAPVVQALANRITNKIEENNRVFMLYHLKIKELSYFEKINLGVAYHSNSFA
jgi:hypothetical protein